MSVRRERVRLVLDDRFSERMARIRDAAARLHKRDVLRQATWEPHDWSDWN